MAYADRIALGVNHCVLQRHATHRTVRGRKHRDGKGAIAGAGKAAPLNDVGECNRPAEQAGEIVGADQLPALVIDFPGCAAGLAEAHIELANPLFVLLARVRCLMHVMQHCGGGEPRAAEHRQYRTERALRRGVERKARREQRVGRADQHCAQATEL